MNDKNWVLQQEVLARFLYNVGLSGDTILKHGFSDCDRKYDHLLLKSSLNDCVFYEIMGMVDKVEKSSTKTPNTYSSVIINCILKEADEEPKKICLIMDDFIYNMTPIMYKELTESLISVIQRYAQTGSNAILNKIDKTNIEGLKGIKDTVEKINKLLEQESYNFETEELAVLEGAFENANGKPLSYIDMNYY